MGNPDIPHCRESAFLCIRSPNFFSVSLMDASNDGWFHNICFAQKPAVSIPFFVQSSFGLWRFTYRYIRSLSLWMVKSSYPYPPKFIVLFPTLTAYFFCLILDFDSYISIYLRKKKLHEIIFWSRTPLYILLRICRYMRHSIFQPTCHIQNVGTRYMGSMRWTYCIAKDL